MATFFSGLGSERRRRALKASSAVGHPLISLVVGLVLIVAAMFVLFAYQD